jgi:INO80 complex subunit C
MTSKGPRVPELKSKRRAGRSDFFSGKGKAARNLKAIFAAEHYDRIAPRQPTFVNIDAPPSMLPAKKYCDITGLPAKYTDPKTKLRFATADALRIARRLPDHKAEEFLALRQAQARIR